MKFEEFFKKNKADKSGLEESNLLKRQSELLEQQKHPEASSNKVRVFGNQLESQKKNNRVNKTIRNEEIEETAKKAFSNTSTRPIQTKKRIFAEPDLGMPNSDQFGNDQDLLEIKIKDSVYSLQPFKQGGICKIFKGIPSNSHDSEISLKMVQTRWQNNPLVRRQFSIESQIVRDLEHEHLPQYICRGVLHNQPYYAYRFVDGIQIINLSQRPDLYPKNIVANLGLNIAKQLFEALKFLHTRLNPIVHGDISSENILIDNQQKVHLIDFGCAHYLNIHGLNAKKWVGKPSFITPEQAHGEPWDHRSDIYQVGILFYELVTGKRWNRGNSNEDKHQFAKEVESPNLGFLAESISIPLSMIFAKTLHANPDCRFQTAEEVLEALYEAKNYQLPIRI